MKWWLGIAAVWTLLALMSVSQTALFIAYRGEPVPWTPMVLNRFADWYTCAIFTPAFVWLSRRWPLERGRWRRHLPILVVASLIAVVLKYSIYLPIQNQLAPPTRAATYKGLLAANALTELMIFFAIIGAIHALEYYRRYRDGEALALQLSSRLARAQLDALRGQLRPHFLFNTLNAIATLIHRDQNAADAMIGRLADLLRASLQHDATHEVPLATELGLARDYVGIMQERFGPRLEVTWDVPSSLDAVAVPAFVLQPLIENAFEHGFSHTAGLMRLEIAARADDGMVELSVSDNGPGLADGTENVGLGNTRQRLRQLYGDAHALRVRAREGQGTVASVAIPLNRPVPMPSAQLTHPTHHTHATQDDGA